MKTLRKHEHPSVENCELSVELTRGGKYPNSTFCVTVYHEKAGVTGSIEQFDSHIEALVSYTLHCREYVND